MPLPRLSVAISLAALTLAAACQDPSAEVLLLTDKPYGASGSGPWGQLTDNALPPKTIILTFDDGPDGTPGNLGSDGKLVPDTTLAIARYLAKKKIHAVFFVNGKRFLGQSSIPGVSLYGGHALSTYRQYDEAVLDELVRLGHRVANHTQDHTNLGDNLPYLASELRATQVVLDRHAVDGPFLFRPPYGVWGIQQDGSVDPTYGQNARADVCLDKLAGPVNWDIDGGDWACWSPTWDANGVIGPQAPLPACLQGYIGAVEARPRKNGVVLMHDRPEYAVDIPEYYAHTANYANLSGLGPSSELALVQALVGYLEDHGYKFGRIEDLFDGRRVRNWSACGDYADTDQSYGTSPSYYRTVALADVDGDGLADACGRDADGIRCANNTGRGQFAAHRSWLGSDFTDWLGWQPPQYGSTVQFPDVSGDGTADVCGRSGAGISCAVSNGTYFSGAWVWSRNGDFSDGGGWGALESYYGSIHFGDVNGDGRVDVCGRAPGGIVCALNKVPTYWDPSAGFFYPAQPWTTADFTDALGWAPPQYGATVQLGDIDGDGRADVCGRAGGGMLCALAKNTGGFDTPKVITVWPDFSDSDGSAGGWQAPAYYKSIRLVDVNGDHRADVCGRTRNGVVCALSNGVTFGKAQLMSYPASVGPTGDVTAYPAPIPRELDTDFTDGLGWAADDLGSTLQFGRLGLGGRLGICGRGTRGLQCGLAP